MKKFGLLMGAALFAPVCKLRLKRDAFGVSSP